MTTAAPFVSVIIPTHNRRDSLLRTLRALHHQSFPRRRMEVFVVADGCSDRTEEMVRHFPRGFDLRVLSQPGRGAATARNYGVTQAQSRLIVFLDDDVEPLPMVIGTHFQMHREERRRVVIGPYFPVFKGRADLHRMLIRDWWFSQFHRMGRIGHRFDYRDFLTGNVSLTKEEFWGAGGFNEAFRNCGAEDWEMGVRLIASGCEFCYAREAIAHHHDHETYPLDRSFQRARQEGRGDVITSRQHPRLAPGLPIARLTSLPHARRRVLEHLAFSNPAWGDRFTAGFKPLLWALERLGFRRSWRRLFGALRWYWYWRGVAEQLPDPTTLADLIEKHTNSAARVMRLDIAKEWTELETAVDRQRPDVLVFAYGDLEIGRVDPQPGAEAFRGTHLRRALHDCFRNSAALALLKPLPASPAGNASADPEAAPRDGHGSTVTDPSLTVPATG